MWLVHASSVPRGALVLIRPDSKVEQTRYYPFRSPAADWPSLSGLHSLLRAFRRSPLGVWVGEGLKEEIAGERRPWRASRAAQPNIVVVNYYEGQ